MNIFDINLTKLDVTVTTKDELLEQMCQDLYESGIICNKASFLSCINNREKDLSTGIGHGIAIPHARHPEVEHLKAVIYILSEGIDFESLDGKPVKLVIMLAIPSSDNKEYMNTLRFISKSLQHDIDRNELLKAETSEEAVNFFIRRQL